MEDIRIRTGFKRKRMHCQVIRIRGSCTYFVHRETGIYFHLQVFLNFRGFFGLVCIPPVAVGSDQIDEMMDFIEANYPKDKKWFKQIAFQNKDGKDTGKYNHLNAVRCFCDRYMPDLLPQKAAPKVKASDSLKDW